MRDIGKFYGHVEALRGVNLTLGKHEVLGLVGDNAAGKSTLMKVLAGVIPPTSGEVLIEGKNLHIKTPLEARLAGIETAHQHYALCGNLDVVANVCLGREARRPGILGRLGFLDKQKMNELDCRVAARIQRHDRVDPPPPHGDDVRRAAPGCHGRPSRRFRGEDRHHGRAHGEPRCPERHARPRHDPTASRPRKRRDPDQSPLQRHLRGHRSDPGPEVGRVAGVRRTAETNQEEIVSLMFGGDEVNPRLVAAAE